MKKYRVITLIALSLFAVKHMYPAPGDDRVPSSATLMYPAAPDPAEEKCLVRMYLPENDPNGSLRILNGDSTLVREISLNGVVGISSEVINVSGMQNGKYLFQLFYKGEAKITRPFAVKHL